MVKQVHKSYSRAVVRKAVEEYFNSEESGEIIAEKYGISRGSLMYHFHKLRKAKGIPRGEYPNLSTKDPLQIHPSKRDNLHVAGFQAIDLSPKPAIEPLSRSVNEAIRNMESTPTYEPRRSMSYKPSSHRSPSKRSPEDILRESRTIPIKVDKIPAHRRDRKRTPKKSSKRKDSFVSELERFNVEQTKALEELRGD